jgi:toxin ParE1/3/4
MKSKNLPVRWSENAENDLNQIFEYIKQDSIKQALKVVKDIKKITNGLNSMPEKFPQDPIFRFSGRNIRFCPIYSYKIVYEVKSESVMIICIFHTAQNPSKLIAF